MKNRSEVTHWSGGYKRCLKGIWYLLKIIKQYLLYEMETKSCRKAQA